MHPREVASSDEALQLVDVREPDEWDAGHVDGAHHIPLAELPGRLEEIDRSRPVVLVCRSGRRSAYATRLLYDAGYDARNLEGGMQEWVAAGLSARAASGGPGRVA